MKQKLIIAIGIALSLCIGNLMAAEKAQRDPFSSEPKTKDELLKDRTPCDLLKIKVFLEKDGKEIGSYTAYVSVADVSSSEVFCEGVIKISDSLYWRINLSADLEQMNFSRLRVDVNDLNMFKKNKDGESVPISIFCSSQQSKGFGNYLCGELQGMTLRVVIGKAEQVVPPNGP